MKKQLLSLIVLMNFVVPVAYGMEEGPANSAGNISKNFSLHEAADRGDLEIVKKLITEGADPVVLDDLYMATPLHFAAKSGHLHIVKYYLEEQKVFVDIPMGWQATPLHFAAEGGSIEVVQYLTDKGAAIDARTSKGSTPLQWAAGGGHLPVVRFLVERGADKDTRDNGGNNVLFVSRGDVYEFFINECGLNPRTTNNRGETFAMLVQSELATSQRFNETLQRCKSVYPESTPRAFDTQKVEEVLCSVKKWAVNTAKQEVNEAKQEKDEENNEGKFTCPVCLEEKKSDQAALTDYGCLNLICVDCKGILQARGDACPMCRRDLQ